MKLKSLLFSFILGGAFSIVAQNNALDFDGINDYVNCGNKNSVQITGDSITLEAWIYAKAWSINVWEGNIINKELNGPNNGYMLRAGAGGKLNFNLGDGAWHEITSSATVLSLNQWHHVAGVYDGAYLRLYVDGVATDSLAAVINIADATGKNLMIGSWSTIGRYFNGSIDEVRVWRTARTKAELNDNMHDELCNNEPGLAAYYKFNQGTPGGTNSSLTTLVDGTANGNNGSITGFALSGASSNWVANPTTINVKYVPATSPALSTDIPAICVNTPDSSAIQITGTLNDAQYWEVRNLSCFGALAGNTTGGQFKVKPATSRTYFVRGAGGCADAGPCTGLSIIVAPRPHLSFSVIHELKGNDGSIDLTVVAAPPFIYDWNNDGVGDWDDDEDLTGLAGGAYTVIVRDSNLCVDTSAVIVNAGTAIGLQENLPVTYYRLYPNPVVDFLVIDLKNATDLIEEIQLVSIVGNVVRKFNRVLPQKVTKLDMEGLESGIYFLKFEWQGKTVTERIVIN